MVSETQTGPGWPLAARSGSHSETRPFHPGPQPALGPSERPSPWHGHRRTAPAPTCRRGLLSRECRCRPTHPSWVCPHAFGLTGFCSLVGNFQKSGHRLKGCTRWTFWLMFTNRPPPLVPPQAPPMPTTGLIAPRMPARLTPGHRAKPESRVPPLTSGPRALATGPGQRRVRSG